MKNKIQAELMSNQSIKSAWFAEKEVQYYKETPMLVFAVKTKGIFMSEDSAMQAVHTALDIDASYIIVPHIGDYKPISKKIKKIGELLF